MSAFALRVAIVTRSQLMTLSTKGVVCITALLIAVAGAEPVVAAGRVTSLSGESAAVSEAGQRRTLSLDSRILSGETVVTGEDARIALEFDDGTKFSLGRDARFKVDSFADRDTPQPGLSLRILRGAFRFVSGLIARSRPRSVSLRLGSVATIGIRGTVVGGEFDGSATVVLLEPEDPSRPTAIEVFNDAGSVLIDEPGFGTDVADANTAPTPPRRMRLRAVENLTRTIRNIGRVPRGPRIRR